jgi:hypothetical protein
MQLNVRAHGRSAIVAIIVIVVVLAVTLAIK